MIGALVLICELCALTRKRLMCSGEISEVLDLSIESPQVKAVESEWLRSH